MARRRPTFFLQLHAVESLASALVRRAVAPAEAADFAVYSALSLGPDTPTGVAHRLGLPLTTASSRIGRLTERGHAARVANPADGRSILVELTEAGWAELHRMQPGFRDLYRSVRGRLAIPEEELEAVLAAFADALRAELESEEKRPVARSVVEVTSPAGARPPARARQNRGT